MKQLHVLVVDDHPLMRRALVEVIGDEPDLLVVGEARNGQEAVDLAAQLAPDVIVMDLLMPVLDGVQAVTSIRTSNPQARILALSSSTEESRVLAAVSAGVQGYLSKDSQPADILNGIRTVGTGGSYLPPEITARLIAGLQQPSARNAGEAEEPHAPLKTLSPREQEILDLLAEGLTNKAMAQKLTLSEATIRSHVYHILDKLGLEDRSQAIVYALRSKR